MRPRISIYEGMSAGRSFDRTVGLSPGLSVGPSVIRFFTCQKRTVFFMRIIGSVQLRCWTMNKLGVLAVINVLNMPLLPEVFLYHHVYHFRIFRWVLASQSVGSSISRSVGPWFRGSVGPVLTNQFHLSPALIEQPFFEITSTLIRSYNRRL